MGKIDQYITSGGRISGRYAFFNNDAGPGTVSGSGLPSPSTALRGVVLMYVSLGPRVNAIEQDGDVTAPEVPPRRPVRAMCPPALGHRW